MSEAIYTWLLRLYPASFRAEYREEALQLLRDRSREERGAFFRLRLWFDLLLDLIISLPRAWRSRQPAAAIASVASPASPVLFRVLDEEPPSIYAFFTGTVVAIVALICFALLAGLPREDRRSPSRVRPAAAAARSRSQIPHEPPAFSGSDHNLAAAERPGPLPKAAPVSAQQNATGKLDKTQQQRVIEAVIDAVNQHYFDKEVARQVAKTLRGDLAQGDDNTATDGAAFAGLLTQQLRQSSGDADLLVEYSPDAIPEHRSEPTPAENAQYQSMLRQMNCAFSRVELQPNGIGYLKMDAFADRSICEGTAKAAMSSLNNATAIIFDLRDNRGGDGQMVSLMVAYLFDHPQYLYSPRENATEHSWTSPVPGNRLANKPVYILTSRRTFSAAEQFCYDLKALKRAILVGESTGGGAHAGAFYRVDDHFGMGIPEVRVFNPYGKSDWEGVGVPPDIAVDAARSLEVAEKLALKNSQTGARRVPSAAK